MLQQRRSWLILIVAMVVGILVISSCAPAATPETIVETVIQTVEVEKTIIELRSLDPCDVLGRGVTWSEELEGGPIRAALDACCDELRDGCGLAGSDLRSDRESREHVPAEDWKNSFLVALQHYRETAGTALETSLGRLPLPTARSV